MKPLSVYGLAIEDGTICWSSLYEDSAYGVVAGDNGIAREWPENVVPFYREKCDGCRCTERVK